MRDLAATILAIILAIILTAAVTHLMYRLDAAVVRIAGLEGAVGALRSNDQTIATTIRRLHPQPQATGGQNATGEGKQPGQPANEAQGGQSHDHQATP